MHFSIGENTEASRVYDLIDSSIRNQQDPSVVLFRQWRAQAGADNQPVDCAVWCWNKRNVDLKHMSAHLRTIREGTLNGNICKVMNDLCDAVDLVAKPEEENELLAEPLKAVRDHVISSSKNVKNKFAKKLYKFFTPDKSLEDSFLDFIKDDPKMAGEYLATLKNTVEDHKFLSDKLNNDNRKKVISKLDLLESLASAQLRYRTDVNNNRIKWTFVSALGIALYVYRQVLANILHTVCVSTAFNPVASTLLLAVAGGVYYYRSNARRAHW